MITEQEYNPLDYQNLTLNVVRELMSRGPFELPLSEVFLGSGVYALFYDGNFKPYARLRSPDSTYPIYVGKAVPPGSRKGTKSGGTASSALFERLKEHCQSIKATETLKLEDFKCRYLVVIPLWITMAERFLIEHYQPVWNCCIEGFGNHDPGSGRHEGMVSWWDTLHPGRQWATRLVKKRTNGEALSLLSAFIKAGLVAPDEPEDSGHK